MREPKFRSFIDSILVSAKRNGENNQFFVPLKVSLRRIQDTLYSLLFLSGESEDEEINLSRKFSSSFLRVNFDNSREDIHEELYDDGSECGRWKVSYTLTEIEVR